MRVRIGALQIYILPRVNVLPKFCYGKRLPVCASALRHGTSFVANQGVFEVDSGLEPGREPQYNAEIRKEEASSFLLVSSLRRFFTQKCRVHDGNP